MAYLAFREGVTSIDQGDLAARISERLPDRKPYTQAAVSKWIGARTIPDVDTIGIIADVCGVRPAWLAYDDGRMTDNGDGGISAPPESMVPTTRPSSQRREKKA